MARAGRKKETERGSGCSADAMQGQVKRITEGNRCQGGAAPDRSVVDAGVCGSPPGHRGDVRAADFPRERPCVTPRW
jgi:hypothetical protein